MLGADLYIAIPSIAETKDIQDLRVTHVERLPSPLIPDPDLARYICCDHLTPRSDSKRPDEQFALDRVAPWSTILLPFP